MTILITGGAGFIGSNLADVLTAKEKKIAVLDNFNDYYPVELKKRNVEHNLSNSLYKLYKGDVNDCEILDKVFGENNIDCVVHLAGQGGVRPSIDDPLGYIKNNISGTVNILEKMREYKVKKIVFASSSSVYGNCEEEKFSEDFKIGRPVSPYAATKTSCEEFLYTYSYLYNIKAVSLRFFTVFGPRQRPDLAICKFINLINKDEPVPVFGDGTTIRDYTYIDDIIDGIIRAIDYDKTNFEIINLGANNPVTLDKMIKTIENCLGKKAKIQRLPFQSGDVFKTTSDITKAKVLLGYTPKTSFEEGIKKFVDWLELQNSRA